MRKQQQRPFFTSKRWYYKKNGYQSVNTHVFTLKKKREHKYLIGTFKRMLFATWFKWIFFIPIKVTSEPFICMFFMGVCVYILYALITVTSSLNKYNFTY